MRESQQSECSMKVQSQLIKRNALIRWRWIRGWALGTIHVTRWSGAGAGNMGLQQRCCCRNRRAEPDDASVHPPPASSLCSADNLFNQVAVVSSETWSIQRFQIASAPNEGEERRWWQNITCSLVEVASAWWIDAPEMACSDTVAQSLQPSTQKLGRQLHDTSDRTAGGIFSNCGRASWRRAWWRGAVAPACSSLAKLSWRFFFLNVVMAISTTWKRKGWPRPPHHTRTCNYKASPEIFDLATAKAWLVKGEMSWKQAKLADWMSGLFICEQELMRSRRLQPSAARQWR
jgi:hypothetical protein